MPPLPLVDAARLPWRALRTPLLAYLVSRAVFSFLVFGTRAVTP